jgi:hypothetical protein
LRKRAISPVIAVILLIGLAVAAVAAIFLVVLPLTSLDIIDFQVLFKNASDEWEPITLTDPPVSKMEPEEIPPPTSTISDPTITALFELPTFNDDNPVYYKITLEDENGVSYDTTDSKWEEVEQADMRLEADRPSISHSDLPTYIRGPHTFRPTLTDNVGNYEGIKNVSYHIVDTTTGGLNVDFTYNVTDEETSFDPDWTWNTRNDTQFGVNNASYTIIMTVFDYSGLSFTPPTPLSSTVDNDYVSPVISNIIGASLKHGADTAEVGEFFSVNTTVTDSGSHASAVKEDGVFLYYKLNDSSISYTPALMTHTSGNTWQVNIPASFIDSDALAANITYYITATDTANNPSTSNNQEAGVIDTTKPDITDHDPVIQVDWDSEEKPTISISVTVVDNDIVDSVTLVWREGNDTGLLIPDKWKVANYVNQYDDTWEFTIPKDNVTLDGIDYYINATDPSGNANDGAASSPYHITVNDLLGPTKVAFEPALASPAPPGQDVTVRVTVSDNDPSFSTYRFIPETGSVKVSYKVDSGPWSTPFEIQHTAGDSSLRPPEEAVWQGTIGGGNFTGETTVTILAEGVDDSGQTTSTQTSVLVAKAGTPILQYVEDSTITSGASSHILEFDIENTATIDTAADAIIHNITVDISVNTKGSYIGNPLVIQINAAETGGGGTNPRWTNVSTPSEGASGYEISLTNSINIDIGDIVTFTLTFANDSGDYFNINDMTIVPKFGFTYASGTDTGYSDTTPPDNEIKFNTTITAYQTTTETRYMRSDSVLGVTQSTGFLTLNERSGRWTGPLSCSWYIEVWIRSGTLSPLSSGKAALVSRSVDGNGLQSNTWDAPNHNLNPTDSIVIRVYMEIGTSTYGPVEFETEQLGAEDLVASTWTIWYYTERDFDDRVSQYRTRGIFYYGDSQYNSRIENIKYQSLPGGAPMVSSKISIDPPHTMTTKQQSSTQKALIQTLTSWKQELKVLPSDYKGYTKV